ncbi:MAG: HNH endonuclease [Proteobacteria bacterium]|nr:HNH endonuclease [Pseudomonadota bacterium]
MAYTNVLVLNRSFIPLHMTTVRRAFSLLYQDLARAVNEEFRTFDFQSWSELSVATHSDTIGLVDRAIRVPRVIALTSFDRFPRRTVRFSRINILARDQNTCQYCGKRFTRTDLNLDHVNPRSRGGLSTWENVVTSCIACNRKKAGRTPAEAGMKLIKKPVRPKWTPLYRLPLVNTPYKEWQLFLDFVDAAYWHVELEA